MMKHLRAEDVDWGAALRSTRQRPDDEPAEPAEPAEPEPKCPRAAPAPTLASATPADAARALAACATDDHVHEVAAQLVRLVLEGFRSKAYAVAPRDVAEACRAACAALGPARAVVHVVRPLLRAGHGELAHTVLSLPAADKPAALEALLDSAAAAVADDELLYFQRAVFSGSFAPTPGALARFVELLETAASLPPDAQPKRLPGFVLALAKSVPGATLRPHAPALTRNVLGQIQGNKALVAQAVKEVGKVG